ncbi:MAG: hypothetical protein RI973_1936 [Bacteroidota bacterium]|jgi:hypothetical protein
MENKQFDEHIKQALENLQGSYDPAAWDALERRMASGGGPPAGLAEHALDGVVASRLSSMEVPMAAADWERMEQRIAADETASEKELEENLDQLLQQRLRNLESPLQNKHWLLMTRRLEEEFSLRYKLYRYRVAEIALTLLLVMTGLRFAPLGEQMLIRHWPDLAEKMDLAGADDDSNPPVEDTVALPTPAVQAPASKAGKGDRPLASLPGRPDNESLQRITASALPPSLGFAALPPLRSYKSGNPLIHAVDAYVLEPGNSGKKTRSRGLTAGIAKLPALEANAQYDWETPQVTPEPASHNRMLRFSIFASTDAAYVFTPSGKLSVFDTLVPTRSDTTIAGGYGGGILVSLKSKRLEIQTGGIYSFRRYMPSTPVFLFETVNYYIRERFNGVQLDMLQVPLNLQYHFKDSGKWRFYGNAGIAGHFITSSMYEIERRRTLSFKVPGAPAAEGDLLEDNSSIRTEKYLPKGLLDGGNFQDNFYLTANLGFGVERFVSSRWSLFVQPNYQHYLMTHGVGANKERFFAFSLNFGTKVNLK